MTAKKNPIHKPERLVAANPRVTTVRDYFGMFSQKVAGDKMGIEIEIETHNDQYPAVARMERESAYWVSIADGSLRTSSGDKGGGREFVFKAPQPFDQVEPALTELEHFLRTARSKVKRSNRTSVHVHVNVQDYTLSQLACLFSLYYLVEPLLGRFNGFDRENNLHALPAYVSPNLVEDLLHFLRTRQFRQESKYSALNYMPLHRGNFGTLEFRQGQGIETSPMETLPWINIIKSIIIAAREFEDPADIIQSISARGAEETVQTFLPLLYRSVMDLYDEGEMELAIFDSMRASQSLAYELDWGDYVPAKKGSKSKKRKKSSFFGDMPDLPEPARRPNIDELLGQTRAYARETEGLAPIFAAAPAPRNEF